MSTAVIIYLAVVIAVMLWATKFRLTIKIGNYFVFRIGPHDENE